MQYENVKYPCEVKVGDIIQTKHGRTREIRAIDGRYIYFTDGSQYGVSHPEIEFLLVPKESKRKKKTEQKEEVNGE